MQMRKPTGAGYGQKEAERSATTGEDYTLGEHLPQVSFAVDEQVVGAFPAQGANPALADRVRSGCLDWSPEDLDAFGGEDGVEAGGVLGVPVADEEPKGCLEVHEQGTGLLGHPRPGRVLGEGKKVHSSSGPMHH